MPRNTGGGRNPNEHLGDLPGVLADVRRTLCFAACDTLLERGVIDLLSAVTLPRWLIDARPVVECNPQSGVLGAWVSVEGGSRLWLAGAVGPLPLAGWVLTDISPVGSIAELTFRPGESRSGRRSVRVHCDAVRHTPAAL